MRRELLVLWLGVAPTGLEAQLGELQVGVLASYGMSDPYQEGAGVAVGVAPGRLVYVGLRWIYYKGATTSEFAPAGSADVSNRAQVFATDLDVQVPLLDAHLEVRPTIGLGMVQFAQRGRPAMGVVSTHSKEFFAAPGLALQVTVGHIAIIPQVQYYFTGDTELPWPVDNAGLAVSVRLAFVTEVRRIRR